MTPPRFFLRFLGPFDARSADGIVIEALVRQPRLIAVLSYLATGTGGCRARDDILGLLWPDTPVARARHSLNQAIYELRSSLDASAIITRGPLDICIDENMVDADVRQFLLAVREGRQDVACDDFRGDFLEGFGLPGAPAELEHWIDGERRRFRKLAMDAALACAHAAERAADLTARVRWALRAADLDPFDEVAAREVVTSLAGSGNATGAVLWFREYERRLSDFDLSPTDALRAFVEEVHASSPVTGVGAAQSDELNRRPVPSLPRVSHAPSGDRSPGHSSGTSDARLHGEEAGTAVRAKQPSSARRTAQLAFALAMVVLVVSFSRSGNSQPPAGDLLPRRLAVAPLENRTGDPSLDAVGFMAADWIIQGALGAGLGEVVSSSEAARSVAVAGMNHADTSIAALSHEFALATRAGLLLTGAFYRVTPDSIAFQAEVADVRSARVVRSVGPVSAHIDDLGKGVHTLRENVVGSVATLLDQRLEQWSDHASQPHSIEAYRHLVDGIDAWLLGSRDPANALRHRMESAEHFRRSLEADSTFTTALIWEYFAALTRCDPEAMRQVQERLRRRRSAMPPWDRAMADYAIAFGCNAGMADGQAALDAARRAFHYAPDSEWGYKVAYMARWLLRYREAKSVLLSMDPDRGWIATWPAYWGLLAVIDHDLGEFEDELRARDRAGALRGEVARGIGYKDALIGLGRIAEVLAMVDADLRNDDPAGVVPDYMPGLLGELRWHGFGTIADSLATLLHERWVACGALCSDTASALASIGRDTPLGAMAWDASTVFSETHPDIAVAIRKHAVERANARQKLYTLGWFGYSLARAGRVEDAQRVMAQLPTVDITDYEYQSWHVPYFRGLIHAALGDREAGFRYFRTAVEEHAVTIRHGVHPDPFVFLLGDYPPFVEFTRIR